MAITLKQIAAQVGLTQPAVSNILNNKGHLYRTETREKVLRVAKELGYRTNAAAKATATGRFGAIAMLLSTEPHRSSLFTGMMDGIQDGLAELDLHLTVAKLPDEKLTNTGYVPKILRQLMADGLLINYNADIPPSLIELIAEYRVPSVWINSRQEANCVFPDDLDAGHQATRRLLALGHQRIAFVSYSGGSHYSTCDRQAGYKAAMAEAGLPSRIITRELPRAKRVAYSTSWLSEPERDRPTAVICYSETTAWPTIDAARALGMRVPPDLSVVTFHGGRCDETGFAIDTFVNPTQAVGRESVRMLLAKIEDPNQMLPPLSIKFGFEAGESCLPWHK